ncbi:MAG: hypothetical protein ACFCD0_23785 [Gemmataceae bacterium]
MSKRVGPPCLGDEQTSRPKSSLPGQNGQAGMSFAFGQMKNDNNKEFRGFPHG